jgi:hypothetical protein
MDAVLPGVISSVVGAVVAAITSILVIKYQLERNLRDATTLAAETAVREERARLKAEGRAAVHHMMQVGHDMLGYFTIATSKETSSEFIEVVIDRFEPSFDILHKEVWLGANKIPAGLVARFYEFHRELRPLLEDCRIRQRTIGMQAVSEIEWLEEHKRQLHHIHGSFRNLMILEFGWDKALQGDTDYNVHGTPIDYWPGPVS